MLRLLQRDGWTPAGKVEGANADGSADASSTATPARPARAARTGKKGDDPTANAVSERSDSPYGKEGRIKEINDASAEYDQFVATLKSGAKGGN